MVSTYSLSRIVNTEEEDLVGWLLEEVAIKARKEGEHVYNNNINII